MFVKVTESHTSPTLSHQYQYIVPFRCHKGNYCVSVNLVNQKVEFLDVKMILHVLNVPIKLLYQHAPNKYVTLESNDIFFSKMYVS